MMASGYWKYSHITGPWVGNCGFSHKGPLMWRFFFLVLSLKKLLNKQSRCKWYDLPWSLSWLPCYKLPTRLHDMIIFIYMHSEYHLYLLIQSLCPHSHSLYKCCLRSRGCCNTGISCQTDHYSMKSHQYKTNISVHWLYPQCIQSMVWRSQCYVHNLKIVGRLKNK